MSKPIFDVKKFYPDMKVSANTRGIVNSYGFSSDTRNKNNVAQGASIDELKKKYFGSANIQVGPQQDDNTSSSDEKYFTEDAIPEQDNVTGAVIIEPELDNMEADAKIVGKKTIITENGEPKASQG